MYKYGKIFYFYILHFDRPVSLYNIIVFFVYVCACACIGKLPTGNISTGYQKQRKKDMSPRQKVSKVNLWFRKCVLWGWCFFIHTRPIRSMTNESILSAFSGSGREKRVFNWNPIFFLPPLSPPRPKLCLQIREKTDTTMTDINFNAAVRCSVYWNATIWLIFFTWRP